MVVSIRQKRTCLGAFVLALVIAIVVVIGLKVGNIGVFANTEKKIKKKAGPAPPPPFPPLEETEEERRLRVEREQREEEQGRREEQGGSPAGQPDKKEPEPRIFSSQRTLYQILGVETEAKPVEIKKAYHALAKELHPDKHMDESEKYHDVFKELKRIYEILSDPRKREMYDLYGKEEFPFDFDDE